MYVCMKVRDRIDLRGRREGDMRDSAHHMDQSSRKTRCMGHDLYARRKRETQVKLELNASYISCWRSSEICP
jgi:hypothetical protein